MLSIAQKKAIYQAVKTAYTVNGEAITCSKIYSNQKLSTYPTFILYHASEEDVLQDVIGNFIDPDTKGQRSTSMLSVNLYAKQSDDGLDAHRLGADIIKQFSEDVHKNWSSLSSDSVHFLRKSPTRTLTNIEIAAGITDVARYQTDIFLTYNMTW